MTNEELIAKIREEIEQRIHDISHPLKDGYEIQSIGKIEGLSELLDFLSTLEEQQKEVRNPIFDECVANVDPEVMEEVSRNIDIEDELVRYFGGMPEDDEDKIELARHFAQWGAEHAKIDVTDFCEPIDPGIAQCIADHSWEMLGEDEKPVPNDLDFEQELYNRFGQVKDFTLGMRIAKYFYELGLSEKPNNHLEGLEEAAENYIAPIENDAGLDFINFSGRDIRDAFIAGAKWQAEQLLKSSPLHEDTVLFNKGVEEGRRLAEEEQADLFTIVALDAAQRAKGQMLKEAVEGRVRYFESRDVAVIYYDDPKGNTMCFFAPSSSLETGDKVKIIIVKEDEK